MTGAVRLSMPPPPVELYVEAVTAAVRANAAWVPPQGRGALYLRPLLLGTGPILGLGPAPSYTLVVYAAAVGCYFKARHVQTKPSLPGSGSMLRPAPAPLLHARGRRRCARAATSSCALQGRTRLMQRTCEG